MPYMELRDYSDRPEITSLQRDDLIVATRDHLARGQEIDGTFEFKYIPKESDLDYCEYQYLYLIDMGWSEERENQKTEIARAIGLDIVPILGSDLVAVRLILQNAAFVPAFDII